MVNVKELVASRLVEAATAVRMKIVPAKGNVVPFRKVANGQEE